MSKIITNWRQDYRRWARARRRVGNIFSANTSTVSNFMEKKYDLNQIAAPLWGIAATMNTGGPSVACWITAAGLAALSLVNAFMELRNFERAKTHEHD